MKTKVEKIVKTKTLENVYIDISDDEKKSISAFFKFRGMQKAFLEQHPLHPRNRLNTAIYSGSYRLGMLNDVRKFIEEHKEEVAEFINDNAA